MHELTHELSCSVADSITAGDSLSRGASYQREVEEAVEAEDCLGGPGAIKRRACDSLKLVSSQEQVELVLVRSAGNSLAEVDGLAKALSLAHRSLSFNPISASSTCLSCAAHDRHVYI